MVRKLCELGLVSHEPYKGVRLTERGEEVALEVIRHHRLLELYLAASLGVPWDRVHAEAEVLEHVLSEELEDLIAAKLGHPTRDPHGDPIPTRELVIAGAAVGRAVLARARRARHVRAHLGRRPGDAALPRRARDRARRRLRGRSRSSRSAARCSPRFGDDVHVLGGRLADAMRVEVDGVSAAAARRSCEPALAPPPVAPPHISPLRPIRARGRIRGRLAHARPRLRRRRRLHRPRQLRHQHRRRREVRLPARLGDHRREPDGDARAVPVGQGRRRHGPQPPRAVPRRVPAPGRPGACGCRRRSSRSPPTSPSSSARRSRSTSCSASRPSPPA